MFVVWKDVHTFLSDPKIPRIGINDCTCQVKQPKNSEFTPPKLNSEFTPEKMMVGRLLSFWEGNFSGAMLNFRWVGIGRMVNYDPNFMFRCEKSQWYLKKTYKRKRTIYESSLIQNPSLQMHRMIFSFLSIMRFSTSKIHSRTW